MLLSIFSNVRGSLGAVRDGFVRVAFLLFDRVLPVRDDFWCFCTWQSHSHTLDNPRAVFEEVKADPSVRKILLQKQGLDAPVIEGENIHFVPAESIRGAYYLARSRVVLIGYALLGVTSYSAAIRVPRHVIVQLWHGIPLKRIGHLFRPESFWAAETPKYAATVCSSEEDRTVMLRAFALPPERVWLTGLPRNDLILKDEDDLPADYRAQLSELDHLLAGRRLVLYAPTWRENTNALDVFSREDERRLEEILGEHGAVLGIRGHSNVRSHDAYTRERGSEAIVSLNALSETNLILRRTDVLVTDYSSIYIDFLLRDRPILHYVYDLEDYLEERGLLYDVDVAFGGESAYTLDELFSRLHEALMDPGHGRDRRERASTLFHGHDGRAASEVSRRIRELVSARTFKGEAM